MKLKNLNRFYWEVQSIDVHDKLIEGRSPAMTLEHYDQTTANYDAEVIKLREIALTTLLQLNSDQIQFNVNRLQLLDERMSRFWKWFSEENKKHREGEFSTSEFLYFLNRYLQVNRTKFEVMTSWLEDTQSFLHDLHDAMMYKQAGVKYLLYEIKEITGIQPKLTGDTEGRAKEEDKLTGNTIDLLCTLSGPQTTALLSRLSAGRYIDSITLTQFSELLLGSEPIANPIQWLKSNRALAYLFRQMHTNGYINSGTWQNIIQKRALFLNKNGKPVMARDLAQAITDYQNKGNPTEASDIDSILEEIRALKD